MNDDNIAIEKSYEFAIKIVNLSKLLDEKHAYALSNQVIKSGTSIGANIAEAQQAQSKKDFISKLSIALKEASETVFWLNLLKDTGYLTEEYFTNLNKDCNELIRLLTAIIKTSKQNNN